MWNFYANKGLLESRQDFYGNFCITVGFMTCKAYNIYSLAIYRKTCQPLT